MDLLEQFINEILSSEPPPEIVQTTLPGEPEHFKEGIYKLIECDAPQYKPRPEYNIEQTRRYIDQKMTNYLATPNPEHMLLVPAPAGIGKTFAGVKLAHWALTQLPDDKRIFYPGPRTDFFADVIESASKQAMDTGQWYRWIARQKADEAKGKVETCRYYNYMQSWLHRGYKAQAYCQRACGGEYRNKLCPYTQQTRRTERLIYGNHNHITNGHPLAEHFSVVIGDEDPFSAFFYGNGKGWHIPTRHIHFPGLNLYDTMTEILYDLQKLSEIGVKLFGHHLFDKLDPYRVYEACLAFDIPSPAKQPALPNHSVVSKLPFQYLHHFVPLFQREAANEIRYREGKAKLGNRPTHEELLPLEYPTRITVNKHGLTLNIRRYVNESWPSHFIWLDATGRKDVYEQMFQRPVEVLDYTVPLKGEIIQITTRSNNKSTLFDEEGKLNEKEFERILYQIRHITKQHKNPAVITYKDLEAELVKEDANLGHFYANRGTNRFEDNDALIVVGTPSPKISAIVHMAKALWFDSDEDFDRTWVRKYRKYNYVDENGVGRAYPVGQYADERLNALLWMHREAEVIQTANRARIVLQDTKVYMMTNIPIDELPPTKLITISELLRAPTGAHLNKWAKFLFWIDQRAEQNEHAISRSEIMEALSLSKNTAKKYMEALLDTGDWELAIVRKGKGNGAGRPTKMLTKVKDHA